MGTDFDSNKLGLELVADESLRGADSRGPWEFPPERFLEVSELLGSSYVKLLDIYLSPISEEEKQASVARLAERLPEFFKVFFAKVIEKITRA